MTPEILAAVGFGLATGLVTLAGGAVALLVRPAAGVFRAVSAGAVFGVAAFDLAPGGLRLVGATGFDAALLAYPLAGFVLLASLEAVSSLGASRLTPRSIRLPVAAAGLTAHSFLDGLAIGAALLASLGTGVRVGAAVLAHDLCDGANVVAAALAGGAGRRSARLWLVLDALAPLAGILIGRLLAPPAGGLGAVLLAFSGAFLFLALFRLLPEAVALIGRLSAAAGFALGLAVLALLARLGPG